MKQIEVVAAILTDENRFFSTQRGYGEFEGFWEFPGGKLEYGEKPEEALRREIREELDIAIQVERFLCTVDYDYPLFHLKMHCYICHTNPDSIVLKEHKAGKWLTKDELDSVNWLPADKAVVKLLK